MKCRNITHLEISLFVHGVEVKPRMSQWKKPSMIIASGERKRRRLRFTKDEVARWGGCETKITSYFSI